MEEQQLQHVLSLLPNEEIRFAYHRDRYALMLLSYFVGEGRTIREIKTSRYAGLLEKPAVKRLTRSLPNGKLTAAALRAAALRAARFENAPEFVVTLGRHGCETVGSCESCQTSRGGYNLVVQVNFPDEHDRNLIRLVAPGNPEFTMTPYSDHPISDRRKTMAWVRIDIDHEGGEALIEEVQNDWIRSASYKRGVAERLLNDDDGVRRFSEHAHGAHCAPRDYLYYTDRVLKPYVSIWAEATLAAAVWLLVELLGVERIFYHTPASGAKLKGVDDAPVSLYTDLPRKFCFREVNEYPSLLAPVIEPQPSIALAAAGGKGEEHAAGETLQITVEEDRRAPLHLLDLR